METYLNSEPFFERCNFAVLFFSVRASPSHQALDSSSSCPAPVRGPLSLSTACSTQIGPTSWRQNLHRIHRRGLHAIEERRNVLESCWEGAHLLIRPRVPAPGLSSERFHLRFLGSHILVLPGQASKTVLPCWPGRSEGPSPGAPVIAGK